MTPLDAFRKATAGFLTSLRGALRGTTEEVAFRAAAGVFGIGIGLGIADFYIDPFDGIELTVHEDTVVALSIEVRVGTDVLLIQT